MLHSGAANARPGASPNPLNESLPALPTIEHTGLLEDLSETPACLLTEPAESSGLAGSFSCSFCGVGDSGVESSRERAPGPAPSSAAFIASAGFLKLELLGRSLELPVRLTAPDRLELDSPLDLSPSGVVVSGELVAGGSSRPVVARELPAASGMPRQFALLGASLQVTDRSIGKSVPTTGCVKLKLSTGQQSPVFPIHLGPSLLAPGAAGRRPIGYSEGIALLADLLLSHRPPAGRTLLYACGQIDYFAVFAIQEVLRLLGVRNLTGNAEHCLNAGAVHNEILTGQEGPFLTIAQGLDGPGRFYLMNGWNGLVSHPPAFYRLLKRPDLDAYLVEVAVTESAMALAAKLGPERVLLVRPGSDPHLALAVAHELLSRHAAAVDRGFLESFGDGASHQRYVALASSEEFTPDRVAARIAPEASRVERLAKGIRDIAARLANPGTIPINIPSVGLSQTKGAVSHCLWGSLLGLLGKYGLRPDGNPAGGTLRIPGQINAQTEVQGLSRNVFMGRIRMTPEGAREAALRMGLPEDAYTLALEEQPRAALDYSDPCEPARRELFLCFGTQFESNMMGRRRWLEKLRSPSTTLVVVDPIPDPFTLANARLVLPSPPHVAVPKLYQNGEWRLTLSVPRKAAPRETRSDATILYDAMAAIARRLDSEPELRAAHPDLARHAPYMRGRFGPAGLPRPGGEVSRPILWKRVLDYMAAGEGRPGALYCRPEHEDGRAIEWEELLARGSVVYGGVGTRRFRLDPADTDHPPFADIHRRPRRFTFFVPTEKDLAIPEGILLNSGRSTLTDDRARIRFASATFNSGKATPAVDMPEENFLHVSPSLAGRLGVASGDRARVTGVQSGGTLELPVTVTARLAGDSVYVSFHKCRAELEQGRYLNDLTSHAGRCPYTSQSNFKSTEVTIERIAPVSKEGVP